jgi:two-component system KDP operon response regulator KdpE
MTKHAETILVVDDEPQIRRFLRTSLAAHGYDVLEAIDGAEALRQATTGHPDLIVLDLGADDYITKPFGMAEFIARVRGAFRRRSREHIPQAVFTVGGLEVDVERRIVRLDGAEIRLSPTQYQLLYLLVGNAGKVVTHQHLLREVWGPAHTEDVQYLRVFMRKLRSRIEADPARPRYLLTELGVGYRLRSPDQLPEQI